MIKKVYSYDTYYDSMMNRLIEVFSNRNSAFLNKMVISELTIERKVVLLYKLLNYKSNDRSLVDVDIESINDLDNYQERRNNKIDELYHTCNDLDEKKKLIFNKIFGFILDKPNKLLIQYGFSLDKFDNDTPLKYIRIIKYIVNENSIDNVDIFYNNLPILGLEDRFLLEQELKKVFNRSVRDSLYKVNDNQPIKHLSYNGHDIPVYKPSGEFHLLVNSLSAYRNHDNILDYDAFWNNNSNVQNHGICCSLISNQNICGTAPIHDVVVGFDGFADTSIQLAGSTDIFSTNNEFELSASRSRFMTPEDYVDETRYTHNELVIERTELRKNINSINIKPSYVIMYDYFDQNLVNKSLKAASELHVPIVYLDTKEIVLRENIIINNYSKESRDNLDIDSFSKFFTRFLNNLHGLVEHCPDLAELYFSEKRLKTNVELILLNIDLAYSNGSIDKDGAVSLYEGIIKVLEKEYNKTKHSKEKVIDIGPYIENAKTKLNIINQKEISREK